MAAQIPDWWGPASFAPRQVSCYRLGPLTVTLRVVGSEWQIASLVRPADDDAAPASAELCDTDPLENEQHQRLVFSAPLLRAHVGVGLADRPVVSRPAQPLQLAPGQRTTIYVHAPLWLQIRREADAPALVDLPVERLSDTWFGPSTLSGELCYTSHTKARLELASIRLRPHRAITPVRLNNEGSDPLKLDKINLPEPYLALYHADNGLWTDAVELTRNAAGEIAPVHVAAGAPTEAVNGRLLRTPRKATESGGFLGSFTALFG